MFGNLNQRDFSQNYKCMERANKSGVEFVRAVHLTFGNNTE